MENNRYELYRGREIDGKLAYLRLCGYAFQSEKEPYFRVSLFLFPQNVYYMSKNQGPGYTIFAKATVQEDGKVVFQNPVGFARIIDHIRTHLYVRFPDLGSHMYMSLFPTEISAA
jgi:hypothetical protein